jgi:N-acetylglucosamine-6-phosphate deacetylase
MDTIRPHLITAGRVVTPSSDLVPGTVEVVDGRIASIRTGASTGADVSAPDGILVPGFIDLQINGAGGVDFLTAKTDVDLLRVGRYLASTGVTAFAPTLITAPPSVLREALIRWTRLGARQRAPRIVGLHLEGPFLNPQFKGAHPARYLRAPDPAYAAALLDAARGAVRMVTLAPELPGAHEVIRVLRERGCIVAAGHTGATYDQGQAAFREGVTAVTHLFNAMRPVHHRDPGIVVAALQDPQVTVSLIADFVHTHPAIVLLAVRLKGWERVALITDAIAAAGARGKVTHLGTRTVRVSDAPRLADGTLAGSVLSMDRAVRNVTSLGIPLREAVQMASTTPAHLLGRGDLGRIEEGAIADLVVLDQALHVRAVYGAGERIYGEG